MSVFEELTKSRTDLKEYRLVRLTNGLEALLVSTSKLNAQRGTDFEGAKAAASLCISAGSFCDPEEAQGLAHFLEHMVFMGSRKYPKENAYDNYVTSHGGFANAMTEGEFTGYQFDIGAEFFSKALDMFAQCFISPLLSADAADREINAIESEFKLAIMSDSNRIGQLLSDLAPEGHPVRKFSWGNLNSLKITPKAQGADIMTLLRAFHATHYRPTAAKLVVVAPQGLDELEESVEQAFAGWVGAGTGTGAGGASTQGVDSWMDEGTGVAGSNAGARSVGGGKGKRGGAVGQGKGKGKGKVAALSVAAGGAVLPSLPSLDDWLRPWKGIDALPMTTHTVTGAATTGNSLSHAHTHTHNSSSSTTPEIDSPSTQPASPSDHATTPRAHMITRVRAILRTHKLWLTWSLPPSQVIIPCAISLCNSLYSDSAAVKLLLYIFPFTHHSNFLLFLYLFTGRVPPQGLFLRLPPAGTRRGGQSAASLERLRVRDGASGGTGG